MNGIVERGTADDREAFFRLPGRLPVALGQAAQFGVKAGKLIGY